MAWTPLFEIDTGNKSESQQAELISEQEFRAALLAKVGGLEQQMRLLNARIEEAFETLIDETDIP